MSSNYASVTGNWFEFEFNAPYEGKEIISVNDVTLPAQYLNFMKKHNGGVGDIGETWFLLYGLEKLQELNEAYDMEKFLPNHIIIGSNGGGELYGIDSQGNYFNVPVLIEEEYISYLGNDIEELPDRINELWRKM